MRRIHFMTKLKIIIDNSFDFQNQLNMKDDSTDTKNEATYTAYRGFQSNIGYWQSQ